MTQESAATLQAGKFLTFKLSAESYGIPIALIQEIIKPPPITRVPRQPAFLRGVINLRGRIIPVIELRLRFGMPAKEFDEHTCIVVMQLPGEAGARLDLGAIVDEVSEVLEISDEQMEPPPEFGAAVDTAFLAGVAKLDDRVVMLLDAKKLSQFT